MSTRRDVPGLNPAPEPDIAALRRRALQLKTEAGLTVDDLVARGGLSRRAVYDMLGKKGPIKAGRIDTWFRLAYALDVPFGTLMGELDRTSTDDGAVGTSG